LLFAIPRLCGDESYIIFLRLLRRGEREIVLLSQAQTEEKAAREEVRGLLIVNTAIRRRRCRIQQAGSERRRIEPV